MTNYVTCSRAAHDDPANLSGSDGNRTPGHILDTDWLDVILVAIDFETQLPRLGVLWSSRTRQTFWVYTAPVYGEKTYHYSSHTVSAAKRLVFLETMPAIDGDLVVPPIPELVTPTILWFELDGCNLLERILLLVPLNADAFDRRVRKLSRSFESVHMLTRQLAARPSSGEVEHRRNR